MKRTETTIVCDVCGADAPHRVRMAMGAKGALLAADLCDEHAQAFVDLYGKVRATRPRQRRTSLSSIPKAVPAETPSESAPAPRRRALKAVHE